MEPQRALKPVSCNRCKAKKIKCDRVGPPCDQCEALGTECIYLPRKTRAKQQRSASHKNIIVDILKRLERLENHVLLGKESDGGDDASSTASLANSVMIESTASHSVDPCPPISPRSAFGILDRLKESKVKSQLSSILFQLRYTGFGLFEDEQFLNALQAELEDLESSDTTNEGDMPNTRPSVTKEIARKWLNLFFETHQFGAFQIALPKDFIMSIPELLEIRHVQLDNLSLIIYYNVVFQGMLLDHDNLADRNSYVQYFYQTCLDLVEGWLDKVENTPTDLYATFLMYSMSVEAFNSDLAWEIFGKSCNVARALGYFTVDSGAQDPNEQQMGFDPRAGPENETEKNRKRFEFWHLLRTDCIFRLNFGKPALITQGSWVVNFPDSSIGGNVDDTPRFVQIHFLASMRLTFVLLKYLDLMNTETLQDTVQYNEALENLAAEAKSIMSGWRVEDLLNDTTNQIDLWVCVDILFSGYKLLIILYQSKKSDQGTSGEIVDIARTSLATMQSLVHSAPKMYWGTSLILMYQVIPFLILCSNVIESPQRGDAENDLAQMNWMCNFVDEAAENRMELGPIKIIIKALTRVCHQFHLGPHRYRSMLQHPFGRPDIRGSKKVPD